MTARCLFCLLAVWLASDGARADSLDIAASVEAADIVEVDVPGRHRTLPDLLVRLGLAASCEAGTGVLTINVADTHRSYALQPAHAEGMTIDVVVPARQLPPVPVPEGFCVAGSNGAEETTVRAGISVQTSLRCTGEDATSFSSRSVAADVPLSCRRNGAGGRADDGADDGADDQEPAEAGSSAARNSSVSAQVSDASSAS